MLEALGIKVKKISLVVQLRLGKPERIVK